MLVKDIWAGSDSSSISSLTAVQGTLYFQADDSVHGWELWESDGTEAGTVMVKDIDPGREWGYPHWLTDVQGILYFAANHGRSRGLWRSDGTDAGTVIAVNRWPGHTDPGPEELVYVPDG